MYAVVLAVVSLAALPFDQGLELYQAEEYEAAIEQLKIAAGDRELGSDPYLLMREAYEAAYGVEGAVEVLEQEVRDNVEDPMARNNLACFYMRQRRWKEAQTMLLSALKLDDEEVDARFNLAFLMAQLGQTKGALEHYYGILDRYPDHIRALSEVCFLVSERESEPENAEPYCERAATAAPSDLNTQMNWALVKMRAGDLDGAYAVFESLADSHPAARTYLGYISLQRGELDRARTTFELVLEDEAPADTGEALVGLARVHQSQGNYAESAGYYRQAYELTGSGMLLGAMIKVYLQRYFWLVIGLLVAIMAGLLWRYLGPAPSPSPSQTALQQ